MWAAKLRHPGWGDADIACVRDAPGRATGPVREQPLARREGRRARADHRASRSASRPPQEGPRGSQDDAAVRAGAARRRRPVVASTWPPSCRGAARPWTRSSRTTRSSTSSRCSASTPSSTRPPAGPTRPARRGCTRTACASSARSTSTSSPPTRRSCPAARTCSGRSRSGRSAATSRRVPIASLRVPAVRAPARPGGPVHARGGAEWRALRDADHHDEHRVVLCEPSGRKLFGYGRGDRPEPLALARRRSRSRSRRSSPASRPSSWPAGPRRTTGCCGRSRRSSSPTRSTSLPSSACRPAPASREHLWFEVHELTDTDSRARSSTARSTSTSAREPADATRTTCSPTGRSSTPIGQVTPRSQLVARRLREHGAEVLEAMQASGAAETGRPRRPAGRWHPGRAMRPAPRSRRRRRRDAAGERDVLVDGVARRTSRPCDRRRRRASRPAGRGGGSAGRSSPSAASASGLYISRTYSKSNSSRARLRS